MAVEAETEEDHFRLLSAASVYYPVCCNAPLILSPCSLLLSFLNRNGNPRSQVRGVSIVYIYTSSTLRRAVKSPHHPPQPLLHIPARLRKHDVEPSAFLNCKCLPARYEDLFFHLARHYWR